MAFHTSSFFVGAGTVLATIVVGFGGGVIMTNALVGKNETREPNKIEQRIADAKVTLVPAVSASLAPVSASASGSSEQRPVPPQAVQAQPPVKADPAPEPVEKPTNAAAPRRAVQPDIAQASTAPPAPPETKDEKAARKKVLAEQKRIERNKYAERRRLDKKKNDQLEQVVERVRQVDREDDEREPVRVRSYVAESPFSFMD